MKIYEKTIYKVVEIEPMDFRIKYKRDCWYSFLLPWYILGSYKTETNGHFAYMKNVIGFINRHNVRYREHVNAIKEHNLLIEGSRKRNASKEVIYRRSAYE